MPIQQILFRPKRGWVQFRRTARGDVINADPSSVANTFFELDGVISEQHQSIIRLTKNPVEFGADITDHAIKQPFKITIKGVITNSPFLKQLGNKIPGSPKFFQAIGSTFTGARIRDAYAALVAMQNLRQPFTLYTGLLQYDNMVLTSVTTPNDIKNQLDLTLVFEEIIIPNLDTSTEVGYQPITTTTEVDYWAAAAALATVGIGIASLSGLNAVGELGGLQ